MSVWLVRAGKHGEYEQKFIQEQRIYCTWEGLNVNLARLATRPELTAALESRYPGDNPNRLGNWMRQVWPFAHDMKKGDFVVLPLKSQPSILIGEVAGDYEFLPGGPDPFFHWRPVTWLGEPVPRTHFGQDLLYSFGASLTICRVHRNNAEARLKAMRANGWKPERLIDAVRASDASEPTGDDDIDLEELANDQIAQLVEARFKGHGLTRLVDALLRAQGYTTYQSPEGADGGADILAGAGPLGFGAPRLCVEVKSESTPIARPTVDKLLGAVTKFGANEGLFVSWSGFKPNVYKELAASFFRVRLWTRKELLDQLFAHYDRLDEEIRAELPLRRIWMVAAKDEGG